MDKVYLVISKEFDCYPSIEKAFSNKTKAQAYIDEKMSWKKQLKEETGLDYDEWRANDWLMYRNCMPDKMLDWLDDYSVDDQKEYYYDILEVE